MGWAPGPRCASHPRVSAPLAAPRCPAPHLAQTPPPATAPSPSACIASPPSPGVLLASLHEARTGRLLASGLLYAALLNLKHLALYAAPAYFVLLLRHHCFGDDTPGAASGQPRGSGGGPSWSRAFGRLALLGGGVLGLFGLSFGPFAAMGQLPQAFRRLFPFGRGLLHSYWAANAWAPYAAADKVSSARPVPHLSLP